MTDDTSRAAYRALFESALDAMLLLDDEARVVDANPATAVLRGEPSELVIGRWIGEFIPATHELVRERWAAFLRAGAERATTRLMCANDKEREVEYAATANVMPGRHLWVVRDVTERNRAERDSQFRAHLLDHVEAAVVAVDTSWRVTHWNAAAERLYAVSRDEALGRTVRELVVADGAEDTAREVVEHVRAGLTWEGEFPVRRRNGEPLTAWVVDAPIRDSAGAVVGYVGVAVDMTERRAAERQLEHGRTVLQTMLGSSLDAVVAFDVDGRTLEWNPAAERTFGYTREQAIGADLIDLVGSPDLAPVFRSEMRRYREFGVAWPLNERVEVAARRADGTEFPLELSVSDARLEDGSTIFTAFIRDIAERKQTEALLAARAEQQAAVADLGQQALAGGALGELMEAAVQSMARTLGVGNAALFELRADEQELVTRAAAGGPEGYETNRFPADAGTVVTALTTGEPVVVDDWDVETRFQKHEVLQLLGTRSGVDVIVGGGEHGRPWGVLCTTSTEPNRFSRHDVNFAQALANVLAGAIERRRVENAIRHRALHDDLTGLPNRELFMDRLEHALAQTVRRGATVAVIFIDIDQFKVVNDSFGHQAGDRLLQSVVPRLTEVLRPGDTLARFAGDEFVVLCEGIEDAAGAVAVAERLLGCFAEPIALDERDQFVSASLGIALPQRDGQTAETLIRDADTAMYQAKERGRARYEVFDEHMRVRTLVRMRIDHDLRRAVLGNDVSVHYQPIVSLADGDIAGFEALLRWRHPLRGDIPPSQFIPVAEERGLIGAMGRWVLEQAAEQAVRWRGLAGAAAEPLSVSVNLSPRQFAHGALADEVAAVLDATGLEPERLMLEITESVLMDEAGAAVDDLHALKALGVRLVLDDFGTGYSSLSYLERFPIDALKIDRSFVAGLDTGGSVAIVNAIVSMAHSLDLRVTAEGVESDGQIDQLRRVGCEYAQGWYYGRPAPPGGHDGLISSRLAG